MSVITKIASYFPEVASPSQKRLSFKEKMKWTLIILVLFFILGWIPLYGLGSNALRQFEFLSIILGAKFGSIISLGIGPIVTASIVLQMLVGSGILKFDLTTSDGKKNFQSLQKVMAVGFILLEAAIYVFMGGLAPSRVIGGVLVSNTLFLQLQLLLVFQLIIGGILIMFMDEVVSKWGFGSGLSLFIAAGVCEQIFIRLLSPFTSGVTGGSLALGYPFSNSAAAPIGALWAIFYGLSPLGDSTTAMLSVAAILVTVLVFMVGVYVQSMKVEIPLSFGRVRGQGIRWPLNFLYTSNIPVILVAALMANIQLWASLMQNWSAKIGNSALIFISKNILGHLGPNGQGTSGLAALVTPPNIVREVIQGSLTTQHMISAFFFAIFMVGGSVLFSWFWVQTSGMDAKSQAKQMMASGLQIPGFRRDERVLEKLLERYIGPLTIMGGFAIGVIAAAADLSGTLASGTGILLTIMIVYKLYEEIAQQHMMDMNPMMRKFVEG